MILHSVIDNRTYSAFVRSASGRSKGGAYDDAKVAEKNQNFQFTLNICIKKSSIKFLKIHNYSVLTLGKIIFVKY